MTAYILDASVAAKWVLPSSGESLAGESVHLLNNFTAGLVSLSVPDLFWPEIGNVVWKAFRLGRVSERAAYDAIDWLHELNIPTSSTRPLLGDALQIAITFQRTVYDSAYVALAIASGSLFLTADERLVNALEGRLPVRWLGSFWQSA